MLQFNKYKREYKYRWRLLRTDTDYYRLFTKNDIIFFENRLVLYGGLILAEKPDDDFFRLYFDLSTDVIINNKKSYNNNPVLFEPESFFSSGTHTLFSTFWFTNKEDLKLFWNTHKKSTFTKSYYSDMIFRYISNKKNLIIIREEINNDKI